jgi:LruC domain-containing protein
MLHNSRLFYVKKKKLTHKYLIMIKKHIGFIILLSSILLTSCLKDNMDVDSTVDKTQLTGTGWNFITSNSVTLSVTVKDLQDNPISLTGVNIYSQYPKHEDSSDWDTNITPFTKVQTDANGVFTITFTLESTVKTIYLHIKHICYSEPIAVSVNSSSISLNLHPAGYGSIKSTLKSAKTTSSPWKYEKSPYSASSNLWALGTYDQTGYPDYLVGRDTYTSSFLSAISSAFPESADMIKSKPNLFVDGTTSNLATTAPCNIWVSFLAEGAKNLNTAGYFYYPTGSTPTSASAITKRIVMFPNASDASSSQSSWPKGPMIQGYKAKLMYYDESAGEWTDVFPAGITIGWFIISNGYPSTTPTAGNQGLLTGTPFYSLPSLNSDAYQHNVIYFDNSSQTAVIGFEDLRISYANAATGATNSSDKDFNDVVFIISANPITAIETRDLPVLVQTSTNDTDGDGVTDTNDAYPSDSQRTYDVYFPTSGTGTLAFEDNWPKQGDYDFNDMVIGYKYHLVTNSYGSVKDVKANYTVKAVGANYRNGFAVQFGTGPGNVESVSGQNLTGNRLFDVSSTGYENTQSYAVIPVFPDAHSLFGYTSSTPIINSSSSGVTADPKTIDLNVTFRTPVSASAMGSAPYNPFIVVNQDRGREVHLAGHSPTSKAKSSYFGTEDDQTNGTTIFYRNSSNYPWALDIPANFSYPVEYIRIDDAYNYYGAWALSSGQSYTDWYSNTASGYRNTSNIYNK